METVRLVVQKRHQAGKGVARRLRRAGQLPAVLYGHGSTVAIALGEKDLVSIQQSEAGNPHSGWGKGVHPRDQTHAILRAIRIQAQLVN